MQGYYLSDILQDVVNQVSLQLGYKVHFQFGHPLEIIENLKRLTTATATTDKKYPLIALLSDTEETREGNAKVNYDYEVNCNILILTVTNKKYLANDRIEHSFKKILHPIYDSFLNQINLSQKIFIDYGTNPKHNKFDRLYWGREPIYNQKENLFSDFVDAVELKNLNLKIKKYKICE